MIGVRACGHGLGELRAHPWRAALSGLSLCVGVLAVVAIFTAGAVTAEVFVATEEQRTGRALTANGEIRLAEPTPERVRAALAAAAPITDTGGAVAIVSTPVAQLGAAPASYYAAGGPLHGGAFVTLVAGDLPGVRRLPVLAGRWFDSNADFPLELVANTAAVQRWGGVGTELTIRISPYQPPITAPVVGVIADADGTPTLYAPLLAVLTVRPYTVDTPSLNLLIHHPWAGLGTLQPIAEQMALAGGGELVGELRRVDSVRLLLAQLRTQQATFLAVAVLALAIAALGMLNIGLASVGERARELVIRRAIGATRGDIVAQLLIAALVVAVLAAVVAIGLGWLGLQWWLPRRIAPGSAVEPPGLPWGAMLWGLAASVATTLAGSVLPAAVAARLDIALALRD